MKMTRREQMAKSQLIKVLNKKGYVTYAKLFDLFELFLTKNPNEVGSMIPDEGIIILNENLDIDQADFIVRHEILHEFLEHAKRSKIANIPFSELANKAADYEISNVGYTDTDKKTAKNIRLNDLRLEGLVTSIDYPGWENLTFEEIYEKLAKESPESEAPLPGQSGKNGQGQGQSSQGQGGDQGQGQSSKLGLGDIKKIDDPKILQEALERQAQILKEEAEEDLDNLDQDNNSGQGQGSQGKDGSQDESDDSGQGGSGDSDTPTSKGGPSSSSSGDVKKRNKYDDEAYKNMSPEEKKKERARRRKEAAKLAKEADKVIGELSEMTKSDKQSENSGKIFDSPKEKAEKLERLAKIKEILENIENRESAKDEVVYSRIAERKSKQQREVTKYRESSLTRFTQSLTKFIRDSLARSRNSSWAHINKKYVNSGLLKPGSTNSARGKVPLINVYFDQSGSWDSNKIEKGKQAISTLNKYVTRGELVVKLYYFAERVGETNSGIGSGTNGRPIMEHIKQTSPNNVIILTDGDISDIREPVEVPGAVWLLFYGERSNNLMVNLTGKQLTKHFDVE